MTNSTNPQELSVRIERLVQEYIAATRVAAQAALDRAFCAGATGGAVASATAPRPSRASRPGARRASGEIGTLSERLYEAVCERPGETMTTLAPGLGATARQLRRPMTLLKRAGRVRSVGTRHTTRYFPMARETPRRSD